MKLKYILISLFFLIITIVLFVLNRVENAIIDLTNEWNIANSTKNIEKLKELFPEELVFYGKTFSRDECLIKKGNIFNKYDPYSQVIISDIIITDFGDDLYKSTFKKQVAFNEKTKTYPSYLFFKKIDGEFKIVEEGDEITNSNLNYSSVYETQKPSKEISWLVPIMVSVTSIGLIALGFVNWRKRKGSEIIQPTQKPRIETHVSQSDAPSAKGLAFEKFVIEQFDENYFKIEYWQGDKEHKGRYPESNQNPDLVLRIETKSGMDRLAVECKYQSKINANAPVKFCEEYQLKNYQNFGKRNRMNVYLVLGIGGMPNKPDEMYILPIHSFWSNKISYNELKKYSKKTDSTFFYNLYDKTLGEKYGK